VADFDNMTIVEINQAPLFGKLDLRGLTAKVEKWVLKSVNQRLKARRQQYFHSPAGTSRKC